MNIITQDRGTTSTQMVDPSTVSPLLDQALARLREGDRAVVTLRYLEGQSMSDVSAAVGISEAAAAKRIERARLAVFLHAFAGDLAAREFGETPLLATDLIRTGLPRLFQSWKR